MKHAPCLAALLLTAFLAPQAAADCGEIVHPAVSVKVLERPVREDRTLSMVDLSRIPSASRRSGMEAYDRTLGLTEADIGAKADLDLVTKPDGAGHFCTAARSAMIELEWNTVVRIASQIEPGSCIDGVVTRHEKKHVAIDQRLIPIAQQAIQIALTAVIRKSIAGRTVADSQRNLQDQAQQTVNKAIDIFTVVRTRRQLSLDSKEEYDRVPRACGQIEYIRVLKRANAAGS